MKVAIPVDDQSMETKICVSFGRTPYFLIYDTETKESHFKPNDAATSTGGAGIKAGQIVVDNHVDALVTPRCGENAAEVIKMANILIYKTINDSLQNNIDAFNEGRLPLLEEFHAGFHGHGGN